MGDFGSSWNYRLHAIYLVFPFLAVKKLGCRKWFIHFPQLMNAFLRMCMYTCPGMCSLWSMPSGDIPNTKSDHDMYFICFSCHKFAFFSANILRTRFWEFLNTFAAYVKQQKIYKIHAKQPLFSAVIFIKLSSAQNIFISKFAREKWCFSTPTQYFRNFIPLKY